jgi:hypothetical protein
MPLIIPANSITGGYEVDNSLRFNDGSSDNLTRTLGTPTSTRKCSISFWVKLSNLSEERSIFEHKFNDGTNKQISLYFSNSDNLQLQLVTGGSYDGRIYTSQLFRDVSAWYHVLIAIDTTLTTSGDRLRMYVNGNEVTSFSTELQPSQNYDMHFTSGQTLHIGKNASNSAYYDGYMAEYVFIDGQQLDPTSFGEFDEDSSIWKPIDVSGLTFGTNGFYLDFENSGSLGADVSGNGNNFTVNNLTSIDQTTDTCTNNYATMNPLSNVGLTITEGSLKGAGAGDQNFRSTFAVNKGKWYWEVKLGADGGVWGICNENVTMATDRSSNAGVYGIQNASGSFAYFRNNGSTGESAGFPNPVSGNIMNMAFDADNAKLYIGINGTYYNLSGTTGNPATSSNPTYSSIDTTLLWLAFCEFRGASQSCELNFGNAPFTISSGNADANGYGNFEYAVPSGYYALNTKNLSEFG